VLALGRQAGHRAVAAIDPLYHRFGPAARAIDGDHGGKAGALHAGQRVGSKAAVLPDSVANMGFGQFEQDGGDAADEDRDGVLEHLPGNRVRRHQRRFACGCGEIESHALGLGQAEGKEIESAAQGAGQGQG